MKDETFSERLMKDPERREKLYLFMTFAPIVVNVLIVVGFILFTLKLIGVL